MLKDGVDYPAGYVRWTPERNIQAALSLMARARLDLAPRSSALCSEPSPRAHSQRLSARALQRRG